MTIGERAIRLDHKHPRRITGGCRRQSDALGRQIEIKEIDAHDRGPSKARFPRPQLRVAFTILSGSRTGSPRLILSTFSMPETTLPQAVYCLSRNFASSKQMKNWELAESGLCARAIETVPRTCGSALNSALRFGYFDPPVPVPLGQPVCAMNPSITRWKTMPS